MPGIITFNQQYLIIYTCIIGRATVVEYIIEGVYMYRRKCLRSLFDIDTKYSFLNNTDPCTGLIKIN